MDKTILTQDIQVNKLPASPGDSGILILQQNSVGNHRVTLAAGNIGAIDVALTPDSVTQLNWVRDDVSVYWTSVILTPQLIINQPQQITDLITYVVDSNGVKIKWTAPMGNPPIADLRADRYRIYISQAEIDPNYGITDLPEYKQNLVPKAPGEPEELVVSPLLPGHKYYLTIVSEKIIFGKQRLSAPSNIIVFIASANDVNGAVTAKIIPIDPRKIWPQGLLFSTDEETGQALVPANLADLSTIVDVNGVPEGTPNLGMSILMYGLGAMPIYNRPSWDCIIELDGAWNIEYLYVWLTRNGEIDVQTSLDGVVFDTFANLGSAVEQGKWSKVLVNNLYAQGVKFINLAFKKFDHGIRGFLVYGKRSERGEIRGKKFKRTVENMTQDQRIGTNAFLLEDKDMVRRVSRHTRVYVEGDWVVGRENDSLGDAYNEATGEVILTVDQVKYQFESQNIWNWDTKMAEWQATGQKIMMSTVNAPVYLRPLGYTRPDQAKPVDPGLNPVDLAITTDPMSYKHIARLAYNIAARFGSNPDADPQYIQLSSHPVPGFPTGDTLKRGLNILESLEFRNEADAYWTLANGYHNWAEQAAILSAMYDGHKGALGPGFGARAADQSIKISMSSLAVGNNIGFFRRMLLWWDLNRGIGDYPVDIINYHHYNSSGGSQVVPVYSDVPSEGVAPEHGDFMQLVKDWSDFRDAYAPKMETRLTEIGYDEQWGGVYSPGYREQWVRSRYKGYWLSRMFLLGFLRGLDVINQYWFANLSIRLEEVDPNQQHRDVFLTCGYTDGIEAYNDWNRKPLVSFWYVSNLMTEITGYSLLYPLNIFGVSVAGGLVFETYNPNLMAIAYVNNDTGDTMVAAWLGSANFSSGFFRMYMHPSEGTVEVVALDLAEIRQDPTGGLHTVVNTSANETGKYIDIQLNEAPTFIKTKNVGSKKLEDPRFFNIEAVSNTVVKLAWEDVNIGSNITKIYQSNLPGQDFTEVHSGYIDNGEYIFTNLLEGTDYFYKISFADGAIVSNLSESIGITTLATLAAPENLRVGNKSTNSITLEWDYSLEDQAKIDEFELYRALTVNGIYNLVTLVNKANRTFTNNGLTADTEYFYKMRAKKDFGYSNFTLGFGATTDQESELAPALLSAKTNYSGDRIKLVFDRGLANPAGQHAGFSVVETIAGNPVYISPASISLDGVDNKIAYLSLVTGVSNSAAIVTLSYNKATANVQSTNGVKVESFTDVAVSNNKDSATLLSKRILINITTDNFLANVDPLLGDVWNNIVLRNNDGGPEPTPADIQPYKKALLNHAGVATVLQFIAPANGDANIGMDSSAVDNMLVVNDPFFPEAVNKSGSGIGAALYNFMTGLMFLNCDNTKQYNLRLLFTTDVYHETPRVVDYKSWQAVAFKNGEVPGLSVYLTSLLPTTASFPITVDVGFPVVEHMTDPKVGVHCRFHDTGTFVSGIILEEIIPE